MEREEITCLGVIFCLLLVLTLPTPAEALDVSVLDYQKISDTEGNFSGILNDSDLFGNAVASIGDLDGDGVTDIAVGARADDDGGNSLGAIWILFLNTDGTVKSHQKISDTKGNFTGTLYDGDRFGSSVTPLGDLDHDGIVDIAVGANGDDDGGDNRGAVWILFLNPDGTVKAHQKISDTEGNFTGTLHDIDYFGNALTTLGDHDGDGITDIAAGSFYDSDGGIYRGAVWILFLNPDGTVKSHQKISDTKGNFTGALDDYDHFGTSVSSLEDLDGDGLGDLVVGALFDDDGGNDKGAVWILFLNADGTVKEHQKISATKGNFTGILNKDDHFGISADSLGDIDSDGVCDIIVGANEDDDGGGNRGAVWLLFLNSEMTGVLTAGRFGYYFWIWTCMRLQQIRLRLLLAKRKIH